MTIEVIKAGLQTTVQGRPRHGLRHMGVPSSGAADPLSMALANRLVCNDLLAPALETTLTGVALRITRDIQVAVTGATAECHVNESPVVQHQTIELSAGDALVVGSAERGVRSYIAFAGGLGGDDFLGSVSTYLPAGIGGFRGRALQNGDVLQTIPSESQVESIETPEAFRPPMRNAWTLRAGGSAESHRLAMPDEIYARRFEVGARNDRMGIKLSGTPLDIQSDGRMLSAPTFPGIVQCPENGEPYLLSVDAQTTGGYPRIAKVIRADLHLIGQLKAGNRLSFIERSDDDAAVALREKHAYWKEWLPEVTDII